MRRHPLRAIVLSASVFVATAVLGASAPPVFQQAKTPSGLTYWFGLQESETDQVVAFGWRDGVIANMPGKEGLTRLGPSQIFAGTKDISDGEYIERFNDLHATAQLSGGLETTRGTIRAPRDKFTEVMTLVADALRSPRLAEATINRLRARFAGQSRETEIKPDVMIYRAAMLAILGDHMQTRSFGPKTIEAVTRADIDTWRQRVFSRDDLVIVSSGPLGKEELGRSIDQAFASLPEKSAHSPAPKPDFTVSGKTIVIERDVPQTILLLIGKTKIIPEIGSSKTAIANRILGGGLDSRLLNAVRQDLGAAYGISSGTPTVTSTQLLIAISTPVSHDKAKAALETIRATYAKWREKGVTDAEFLPARAKYLNDIQSDLRQTGRAAQRRLSTLLEGLDGETDGGLEARISGYGVADINEAIADKFPGGPLMTFIVTPSAAGFTADCVIKEPEEVTRCK